MFVLSVISLRHLQDVTEKGKMAVDERGSPQTGDQLRTKNTNKTSATDSSSACEGAADVCKSVVPAEDDVNESAPRTGRGRRKQCRPLRVCLRDDDDNVDELVAVEAKPPQITSPPAEAVGLPAQNVCELCGAEEMSPEALAAHASTCRGRSDPDSDDATSGRAGAFPTPYHELGSELMRGADSTMLDDGPSTAVMPVDCSLAFVDGRTAAEVRYYGRADDESDVPLDFTLHSDQLASSSSSSVGLDAGSTASSVPAAAAVKQTSPAAASVGADAEDFCEFCQKRFCNKYYLRKHRHDVHGVTTSDAQLQQPQPQLATSFLPQDTLPLLALTSDTLPGRDGFISPSSSSTSAQQLPFQTQQLTTSLQPFVLPFQTSTSTTSSLLFQSPPSAADLAASPAAAGLLPGLTSLMLLNPFASSLALLNSPSFLHQTSPAAAAVAAYSASSSLNTLAELQKTNAAAAAVGGGFGGLCDDVAALGALMNPFLPPSDPTVTVDDPLSASHHCELCRKEFCSAYFLAVHRREKHGIATSTALSDAIRLLAAGNGRPGGGVLESLGGGTEPGEKLTSSSGAGGRVGKSHGDRAETSRSTSSERLSSEHICCLCKKQFPNRYGLVLHLLSAHNIRPEGFGLAGELLQMDGVGSRSQSTAAAPGKGSVGSGLAAGPATASSSGSGSSKQSDRVSCDVCNKEVCNKYFLKTHKMKVHGMDSVAAAVYNPAPPPLDSTRSEAARSPASVSSSRQHQQQQQHDEMRKALLMADSQFSAFASHLDFALKSAASNDPAGSAGFGVLPPSLQQQQQPGEPVMTASDIFRLFGLVGNKQDDPFLSLGLPPPPPSLQSLLPGADLCDPLSDAAKHSKPVELKIPKHVAGMTHHHKDVGMQHQQPVRVKHSSGHNGRHIRDQATASVPQPLCAPRQSKPTAAVVPSDQELIQSGIDPEAYCELCQKEFCSKYFLRTHRQKIHGVSASKVDASFDHYRPISQQAAAANPVLQMFPGLPLPTQPIFGSGTTGLLPSTPVVDPSSDSVVVGSQGRTTTSKEAANATRVTCDVCGKELCNKYFLKTHMAKIHGCATALVGDNVELDGGEAAPDIAEKSAVPAVDHDRVPPCDSPSYEKSLPGNVSLANSTDHGDIPPLSADSEPSHRPHSRNYSHETNDFQPRDNSEDTDGRVNTVLDQQSTQLAFAEYVMENGERCLPQTNVKRPVQTNTANASSCVDRLDVGDARQGRSEKRALACDNADTVVKRPRIYGPSDLSTVDGLAENQAHDTEPDDLDRSHDATVNSGVIQFVSASTDATQRSTDETLQSDGSSADVAECYVKQPESSSAPWFTTVNGHVEPPSEAGARQSAGSPPPSLMQPFIVRQEPPAAHRVSPGTEGPRDDPGETTQFAACQLVLPVVRPIRDPLTVEFSVTPVSSD